MRCHLRKVIRITSTYLESLKCGKGNGEYVIDSGVRGQGALLLRVTDSAKLIYYRYFFDGKRRFELVGYFAADGNRHYSAANKGGVLTLAAAREGFHEMMRLQNAYGDLKVHFEREARQLRAEAEDASRRAQEASQLGTFEDLLDVYIAALRSRGKVSAPDVEALFKRHVKIPSRRLLAVPAHQVTTDDIHGILKRVTIRGERQANMLRSYLRAAFAHAGTGHDYSLDKRAAKTDKRFRLTANPVNPTGRHQQAEPIKRYLSESEIKAYFAIVEQVSSPVTRAFLKFHLYTGGQRPRQLLNAAWTNFDLRNDVLTVLDRKGRAKPRTHLVPLLPEALEVLRAITPLTGSYDRPFQNAEDTVLRLETIAKAVAAISASESNGKKTFSTPFTIRDIRRTVATYLAEAKFPKEVRAYLLSHDRGGRIEETYNQHDYLDEKREALESGYTFTKSPVDISYALFSPTGDV